MLDEGYCSLVIQYINQERLIYLVFLQHAHILFEIDAFNSGISHNTMNETFSCDIFLIVFLKTLFRSIRFLKKIF